MKYNNNWVLHNLDREFFFFWGHRQKTELLDRSCLSQWFNSKFTYKNEEFLTAEHWMMAGKAKIFNDFKTRELILKSTTPDEAKKLGRTVKGYDDLTWHKHRIRIVSNGNFLKFTQNLPLKDYLLNTGDKILVEASPYDRIWGIGMRKEDIRVNNPRNWTGTNLLGYCLMEVRDKLVERENNR